MTVPEWTYQRSLTAVIIPLVLSAFLIVSKAHGELEPMDSDQLRAVDGRQGLNLQFSLDASADFLEFTDSDGTFSGPGSGTAGALRFGDFSLTNGGGSDFTTITVDADGSDGLVFEVPSADAGFDLAIDRLTVPDDPSSNSLNSSYDAGEVDVGNIDVTGSNVEVSGRGDGLNLEGTIDASADYLRYDDADGGSGQFLLETPSMGTDSNDDGAPDSPYSFSGLSVDFDENGIAFVPPSESFFLNSGGICMVDGTSCGGTNYIAENLEIDDLSLDQSSIFVRGTGHGLEFDGQVRFTMDQITLQDSDGTPQNSASGTVIFNNIHFTSIPSTTEVGFNDSGGAASFDFNEPALHVDGNEGVFVELPGFDTSGATFRNPANELYVQNMSVGGACTAGSPNGSNCGDWSLRNVDMGGSWINLRGRN